MISLARRVLALVATTSTVLLASVAGAGAASADVPEGWPTPDPVDPVAALLVLGAIPLGLFLLIGFLTYLPSLLRGESLAPGGGTVESQWLGGPRKSAGELSAPDDATSASGGASGRW